MLQILDLLAFCTKDVHETRPLRWRLAGWFLALVSAATLLSCKSETGTLQTSRESAAETVLSGTPGMLDLNSADESEIARLPGVGPRLAERIVAHRERFGPFASPPELMLVDGFSEERFLRIKSLVRAGELPK